MKIFAAIDVGSYELEMKIFEISEKKKVKEIDCLRQRLDLGTETHKTGKLSNNKINELCKILTDFKKTMDCYQVDDYQAYGTSAIREMRNGIVVLNYIQEVTGIHIDVPSNSEQRFLNFKAIAARLSNFDDVIKGNTAIVDIGGAGLQISLFEKGSLTTSQNLPLGILRMRERLTSFDILPSKYDDVISEISNNNIGAYKKIFVKDHEIENIILVDEYINVAYSKTEKKDNDFCVPTDKFIHSAEQMKNMSEYEIGRQIQMPEDGIKLLFISQSLLKNIVVQLGTKNIWMPGATLCDGIAYEYAEKNKLITLEHNFEKDILSSALHISKRYMGSKKRGETLEKITLNIFDTIKKVHGLGKRERFLLRIASLLHDCGRFVSMLNPADSSYEILMATEIIGLSHKEREIVALTIKYAYDEFPYYEAISAESELEQREYLIIAKLAAILGLATGLDRAHKEKFKEMTTRLDKDKLIIGINSNVDISLERNLIGRRAELFEEIYRISPLIKQNNGRR